MKENKYDNEMFFRKYSEMRRSKEGLSGAGEWHEFQRLLPDFSGKRVLDLGCGYGWHCKYALECGASYVLGVDISKRMLERAAEINFGVGIEYRRAAIEDISLPDESFDTVISSLALHYVENIRPVVRNIGRWLRRGGEFVFSVEHPVFTAKGDQDWHRDADGEIIDFPVDNYFYEGRREADFLGEAVIKYHRTLTTYMETLTENSFELCRICEPQPPQDMLVMPGMRDELRRPMMLIVSAIKR